LPFFIWSWGLAGAMSSRLFWNKASSVITKNKISSNYGIQDGIRSAIFALSVACVNLSLCSVFFDCWEYRSGNVSEDDIPLKMSDHTLMTDGVGHSNSTGNSNINNNSTRSADAAVNMISDLRTNDMKNELENKIENAITESTEDNTATIQMNMSEVAKESENENKSTNSSENGNEEKNNNKRPKKSNGIPGVWDWKHVAKNMYEPVRLFIQSNGLIWFIFGIPTAMIANKVMTMKVLSGVVASGAIITTNSSSIYDPDELLS